MGFVVTQEEEDEFMMLFEAIDGETYETVSEGVAPLICSKCFLEYTDDGYIFTCKRCNCDQCFMCTYDWKEDICVMCSLSSVI